MTQEFSNTTIKTDTFPIRESAFYPQIKASTVSGDSASFALIMSMLTTDAEELDEFHLPHTEAAKIKSDLYGQFNIQQKELTGSYNEQRSLAFNKLVADGNKDSVNLDLALQPEPLVPTQQKFPQILLDSLEPNVKCRLDKAEQTDVSEEKKEAAKPSNEIDVEAWFKVLHESRTLSVAA